MAMTRWHVRSDHKPITAEQEITQCCLVNINIAEKSNMWG